MTRKNKISVTALSCVIPMIVYFLFFTIPPVVMMIYYSFTDLKILIGTEEFVGVKNYIDIFRYPEYIQSFGSTCLMGVFIVALSISFGLLIALLIQSVSKGKAFYRTLWYIPVLLSLPIIAKLLALMLWSNGPINAVIKSMGLPAIEFYDSTPWMYFWIIFIIVWKSLGGNVILFIAGFNGISPSIHEASKIDGANRWQDFWFITIPLIRPLLGYMLICSTLGALNNFEAVQLISAGQPEGTTKTIMYRIYDEAFQNMNQGFASALSVFVFAISLLVTMFNMRVTDSSLITGKTEG